MQVVLPHSNGACWQINVFKKDTITQTHTHTHTHDKAFTKDEIIANLKKFNTKKPPGEDGLTSNILTRAFQVFPLFFT